MSQQNITTEKTEHSTKEQVIFVEPVMKLYRLHQDTNQETNHSYRIKQTITSSHAQYSLMVLNNYRESATIITSINKYYSNRHKISQRQFIFRTLQMIILLIKKLPIIQKKQSTSYSSLIPYGFSKFIGFTFKIFPTNMTTTINDHICYDYLWLIYIKFAHRALRMIQNNLKHIKLLSSDSQYQSVPQYHNVAIQLNNSQPMALLSGIFPKEFYIDMSVLIKIKLKYEIKCKGCGKSYLKSKYFGIPTIIQKINQIDFVHKKWWRIKSKQAQLISNIIHEWKHRKVIQKWKKCSGCCTERYCGRTCQKRAWNAHRNECLKKGFIFT